MRKRLTDKMYQNITVRLNGNDERGKKCIENVELEGEAIVMKAHIAAQEVSHSLEGKCAE